MALVLLFACLQTWGWAATPDQWRGRTIYQLLTDRFARPDGDTSPCADLNNYCGGGFKGIQDNLDYITGMGFDAIWISPIVANVAGNYHGYAANNIYEINPNFGSEQDFINMVQACHQADVYVMVDVVANHMGIAPFDQLYPFNESIYYHPFCNIDDWNNQTQVIYCWLDALPDLDQSNSYVRSTLLAWIQDLVTKYDVDGLRIDTVPEVAADFWAEFQQAAGVYGVGEVFNGDVNYVAQYQGVLDGTLEYPLFFNIKDWFIYGNSLFGARSFNQSAEVFPDQGLLGVFIDNHDNPRFLSLTSNEMAFKNAIAWGMTTMGIPIHYYGDEQGFSGGNPPANRETLWPYLTQTNSALYDYVKTVVSFRKTMQVWLYDWVERWADTNFYCFSRGLAMMCFSNTQNTLQYSVTYHPYENGEVVCNAIWQGDCVTVTNGVLPVTLVGGECKLYAPKAQLVVS